MIELFNSSNVKAPAALVCRGAGWRRVDVPVRYGLLRRSDGGLCLVDTGYGPAVTTGERSLAMRIYNAVLRPRLIETQSPAQVLEKRGASLDDVDTVILTHFHADHVARLNEFPRARILAHGAAARAVTRMSARQALHHGIFKELLPVDFAERIEPIEACPLLPAHPALGEGHDLFGDGSCLAIDLPGHAFGHIGLFWQDEKGPSLYATDTTWSMTALAEERTPAISRAVVFDDAAAGRQTEERVLQFIRAGGRVQLCHDWGNGQDAA